MHRPIALFLAASALAAAAGASAAQTTISPGYWEMTNQSITPVPTSKTERRCIRPEDVDKVMGGAPNRHYACTYTTRDLRGGKIRLVGSCKTKNSDPVPVTGEGVYASDSLRLDARFKAKLGGLPVPVHLRTTAKRIGDACPTPAAADAK